MKTFVFAVSLMLFLFGCGESKKTSADELLTFNGRLIEERFWGPPNFGEDTLTDRKEIVPVIILDEAIVAPLGADQTKQTIKKLQVIPMKNLVPYLNKKVTIKGSMFEAQTGHHHTEYLIEVKEINE